MKNKKNNKQKELPPLPAILFKSMGEPISIGAGLSTGKIIPFGGYHWRVLDVRCIAGKKAALIITEEAIEKYNYHSDSNTITWENCDARRYLNDEFLHELGEDSKKIIPVTNLNPDNPWFGTKGGNDTEDSIFLLNIYDVCRYFGDSTSNLKDKGKQEWQISDANNKKRVATKNVGDIKINAFKWYLRSPGEDSESAVLVDVDGSIRVRGDFTCSSYEIFKRSLRPALWLNLTDYPEPKPVPSKPKPAIKTIDSLLEVGDLVKFGKHNWQVLDIQTMASEKVALLITEKVIEMSDYHYEYEYVTWEECDLRKELTVGTDLDKNRIIPVKNTNPDNPWYGTEGGNDTEDRMFLLSLDEVCRYFGDSTYRLKNRGTQDSGIDDENNGKRAARFGDYTRSWYLRSPGSDNSRAAFVSELGVVVVSGDVVHLDVEGSYGRNGVRPAMWVKLIEEKENPLTVILNKRNDDEH